MNSPYEILIRPIISEKSMDDVAEKKYTFVVAKKANKYEIKAAVEEAFGVDVVAVNTANFSGKKKRQGYSVGYTSDYKKAIVTLSKSSKGIEYFEGI